MPVGGNREKKVNVRILAATNASLPTKIATNEFRDDLYFRLAGYIIRMPPLRERKPDIPLLAKHILAGFAVEMGHPQATLTPQALATLENYNFPGNVRELKNLIEHALISSGGTLIQPQHFHFIDSIAIAQPTSPAAIISSHSATQASVSNAQTGTPTNSTNSNQALNDEEKILTYVREHTRINNTECRQLLNLDYNKASYILKKMNREGKLVREGKRRGSYYRQP